LKKTPHKRAAKQSTRVAKAIGDDFKAFAVNPNEGFIFRSSESVWFFVTVLPSLLMACCFGAMLMGLVAWPPLLFAAAGFGLLAIVWLFSALAWFKARGWGLAIMEIEHKKRKEQQYGK
jgi:hypothetical protein